MNWFVQRIATSAQYSASPHEIRCVWSYRDTLEAHMTLDALAEIQYEHRKAAAAQGTK